MVGLWRSLGCSAGCSAGCCKPIRTSSVRMPRSGELGKCLQHSAAMQSNIEASMISEEEAIELLGLSA